MNHGFTQTRHGRIHYLEAGKGAPLVLLHSNGASAFQYEQTLPHFAEHWRVIAMDLPGHGDSDPISHHYSIGMYADAVVSLLDALKIDCASVAGDSVGGSICIALAREHSQRTQPVVISECPLRSDSDWQSNWPRIEATYSQPTQNMEALRPRFRAGAVTPELLSRWNADRNKAGAWTMVDVMWAMREFDAVGTLRTLRGPATAILGAKGNALANRPVYEECLGKERVAVLPECGHFPMIDNPALFVKEVDRLLAAAAKQPAAA